jgi:hypothetical protein
VSVLATTLLPAAVGGCAATLVEPHIDGIVQVPKTNKRLIGLRFLALLGKFALTTARATLCDLLGPFLRFWCGSRSYAHLADLDCAVGVPSLWCCYR